MKKIEFSFLFIDMKNKIISTQDELKVPKYSSTIVLENGTVDIESNGLIKVRGFKRDVNYAYKYFIDEEKASTIEPGYVVRLERTFIDQFINRNFGKRFPRPTYPYLTGKFFYKDENNDDVVEFTLFNYTVIKSYKKTV